jgi:hypothetical protein
MPSILKRKRYQCGGDLTLPDPDTGLARRFRAGDELPAEFQATLPKAEIDVMLGCAALFEIGAQPAAKLPEPPPRPLTVAEVLHNTGWSAADVGDGQVTDGPRGWVITVLDKAPRDSDLKVLTEVYTRFHKPMVVHSLSGGECVATVNFGELVSLLASTMGTW